MTATRSRPSSSTPRRARSTRRCPTGSGNTTSTSSSRTSPSAWRTWGRCRVARGPRTTRSRQPRPSAPATRRSGTSSTSNPSCRADDRHAVRARIRRLNELGFAVDEITLEPTGNGENVVRLKVAVANRRFHARELERLTGLVALEGQARLLLNDLHEYQAWIEHEEGRSISEKEAAERWLVNVLEPSLRELVPAIGPGRDPLQAYCDMLEQKWILSELAGKDVGLSAAKDAYLGLGAPAPESDVAADDSSIALDIDWSTGWEADPDATPDLDA